MFMKKATILLALMMAIAVIFSACSQTERFSNEVDENESERLHAIEDSYTLEEISEEYGGTTYLIPRVEGMTNKSKQADINGHMKRAALRATKDNSGERGAISDYYEAVSMNDYLFSIKFETTLDVDIATRAVTLLIRDHKFLFSIENLFGKAEDNPAFADMRAVFEEAGADSTITDDEFRKLTIYFEGDDITDITLHLTYFTDQGYDIGIALGDVIDYMTDEMATMFEFAR